MLKLEAEIYLEMPVGSSGTLAMFERAMRLFASLCVALSFLARVSCPCPSRCTCDYHGGDDGMGSRYASLLATKRSDDSEEKDSNQMALF
ncbi:hypothetical protein J1605_011636 [Eschrichtius robustus]|uniref:Secreted protein n=1 Tax=Eschrichtius robustus TaxID=9764 RepID=A0AB34GMC5_ESCRO|nr:hypothetical protein J1605_011636 [Eschrichtius robustus]